MTKKEIQKELDELNKKMDELNAKMKDASDTVKIAGMEAKDTIDEKVSEAKGNVAATQENMRLATERGKSKFSSTLLKAQMELETMKKNISDKKIEHNKEKALKDIDETLEYAENCANLAIYAGQEAVLAFLEAASKEIDFQDEYGDYDFEDDDEDEEGK